MFIIRAVVFVSLVASIPACVAQPVRTGLPKNLNQGSKTLAVANAKPSTSVSPGVAPLSTPPRSQSPTPLPSGYVSPLPLSAFPSAPSSASSSGLPSLKPPDNPDSPAAMVSLLPSSAPTSAPLPMQVVLNNLDPGPASITGVTMLMLPDSAIEPLAGTTITVRPVVGTQRAEVVTGATGAYQLGGLAEGRYYVSVRKAGYASDPAPTVVTLGTGHLVNVSNFVLLKE